MAQTKVSFVVPTTNTDGTPITEALTYHVLMDTVNPPVKEYSVPATVVASAAGVIDVTFAALGFVPVNGSTYYAGATATDASGTSAPSAFVTFTYTVVPSAPTGFTVG